jgi:hypothetical protein
MSRRVSCDDDVILAGRHPVREKSFLSCGGWGVVGDHVLATSGALFLCRESEGRGLR